jgi:hypothetical protein
MSKQRVVVCCWRAGHETELALTRKQEEKLAKQIPELKAVCPSCKDQGNFPIFIKEGSTVFAGSKVYRCRNGHITTISPFSNGMLHVTFGPGHENFVNIEGTLEELQEIIDTKDVSCYHVKDNGKQCDCKLKPVDDFMLSYPQAAGIKTKTRVGDLWDKAGLEPVRTGGYDKDGNYQESRSQRANMERLKKMRRTRNIPVDQHPGKRMNRPTKTTYDKRSKQEINPERLKGPK